MHVIVVIVLGVVAVAAVLALLYWVLQMIGRGTLLFVAALDKIGWGPAALLAPDASLSVKALLSWLLTGAVIGLAWGIYRGLTSVERRGWGVAAASLGVLPLGSLCAIGPSPDTTRSPPPLPDPVVTARAVELEAREFIGRWLAVQNAHDRVAYSPLYAPNFSGTMTLNTELELDRTAWLAESAQYLDRTIVISRPDIQINGDGAVAEFVQSAVSPEFFSRGKKRLVLEKSGGELRIARETVLSLEYLPGADPTSWQRFDYIARLGPADHCDGRKVKLTSAAAILERDRFNQRSADKSKKDREDQSESFFDSSQARAQYSKAASRSPSVRDQRGTLTARTPLIGVLLEGQAGAVSNVRIIILDGGEPFQGC